MNLQEVKKQKQNNRLPPAFHKQPALKWSKKLVEGVISMSEANNKT
jgi:hypothetical protein